MKKPNGLVIFVIIFVLAIVGMVFAKQWEEKQPGAHDELAQCINDSGAQFYGAFWCPHCEEQRNMFGNSSRLLPYIECSTPDGQNQTQVCIDAGIESYPTWDLADGTRINGVQSFAELAEMTGCTLPE